MKPLISIIVPVYNVESYLERCIESLINQTYSHLEIILVNDGSTDNSGDICTSFANRDSRISVYHIENGGSSIARNYGLTKSTGDYIGFVDSDDWIRNDMFQKLLDFSIKNNLKVVECSSVESKGILNIELTNKDIEGIIEEKETTLQRVLKNKRFAVWRRIYKIDVVKNRFFKEHILHQDVYYTMDILNSIDKLGFIDEPLYIYNVENINSVIRSKYSIKKLKSIGAAEYVVLETEGYSKKIQYYAKQYLFQFLTSHYNHLHLNSWLDEDYKHRNSIRLLLRKYHSFHCFNFFVFMIVLLPTSFYRYFLIINLKRIQLQNKINLKLKDV
ncbi:glycosyltransferase [Winogradskyella alexanderae]|uniref:Glycosyltransferase n=1 Tax=Winogradskyella alexanderae TaxID=2877123 RepID=A0ABS7XUK3_9FLAO|nr:glycosyltransferase [Winogradskyella alexanderae]MCA0132696.1 glycosyltransferase [Winogradskyella alexanderae]